MILITLITAVLAKYSCNTESYLGLNEGETIRQSIQIGITQYSAVLTQYRILILNQELIEQQSIYLPEISTNWISLIQAQNIIYVISNGTSTKSPQMTAISCSNVQPKGFVCSQFGEDLIPVTSTYGLIQDWHLVENSLLILTTNQLRFYNLSSTASDWTLKTTKYNLDGDFFGYQWSNPSKFDVQQYIVDGNKNYKIFIVDNYNGFWVDCAVRSKQLIPYINGRINFYTPEFQYAYVNDCKFIKAAMVDGEQITSYIFLQTSSQSIQQIMKMTHTNFDIISYSLIATLVPFKSLQPISGSIQYFDEGTITMMVSDKNISWLTFYNISNIDSQAGQIIQQSQYILLLQQDKYDSYVMNLDNNSQKFNFKSDDNAITQCDKN